MQRIIRLALCFCLVSGVAFAGSRDAQWKEVAEAQKQGLPKTAIEKLDPLIAAAMKDKAWAEAIKAIGTKIALEGNIQGNKPEEKITRMQAEIAKAPDAMKPAMDAILANWYWHYFQQNRWRFMQRTQTAEPLGKDFTTWDLPRILGAIDEQFTRALAAEKKLKTIPVADYNDLLMPGTMPDNYRPTMFDFIANNALEFYCAGEQGGAAAEDAFVLPAESPIFSPAAEFVKWRPETTDAASPTLKAIRLYQALLLFHQKDADRTAFIDADLWRLVFGNNKAMGEEKSVRYQAALQRFVDEQSGHEVSARALCELAGVLQGEGDLVAARQMAQRGLDRFPDSIGGRMCHNRIEQIQARSLSIATERVLNEPLPEIRVTYRNLTKVFFRAIQYDFEEYLKTQQWGMGNYSHELQQKLIAAKPALEWSADLPPTADFKERIAKLPAPKGLNPGFYYLLASHDPAFGENNNQLSVAQVWVSDLALVMRQRHQEDCLEGFVFNALTGDPLAGATVRAWARDRDGWFKPADERKSDTNGLFRFEKLNQQALIFVAEHEGRKLATANEYWMNSSSAQSVNTRTVFFTDRALYRPGQTVSYKGICIRFDQSGNKYETLAGQTITVVFNDPNNKEIARQQHRANDYGSFSGSFTAPRDRLAGRMTIRAQDGPEGSAWFNVEEYKRPKFQVELAVPKEAVKLNAEAMLQGKATAYTGAAIGGAAVKYRVVRVVRFPPWCWWGFYGCRPGSESQVIAHGAAVTESDGSFTIRFLAKPDLSVSPTNEPTFEFAVYADVTDSTGETRSGQRFVRVGYTALQATVSADEWQEAGKPVELTITTRTLDGEPQAAEGALKIYALKQPAKVLRPELEGRNQYRYFSADSFPAAMPQPDPADPNVWELGTVAKDLPFKTDAQGSAKLQADLPAGIFRAVLETRDRYGKAVTARLPLQVVDPQAPQFMVKEANHFAARKWTLEPGETLTALWGTGYEKGRAFVEIERDGKLLHSFWTGADRTQAIIEQAIDEDMRGGFTLRVTYVRENRAYLNERVVDVPWSNKTLTLKWEHFTSKLGPAQKDTWTAIITGPDAKKAVAEMVAGLYDASFDAYLPHNWPAGFDVFRYEVRRINAQFENRFQPFQHMAGQWTSHMKDVTLSYREFASEIDEYLWGYGYFGRGQSIRKAAKSFAGMDALAAPMSAAAAAAPEQTERARALNGVADKRADTYRAGGKGGGAGETPPQPDLGKVAARKNLNETAFFFPQLLSDQDGVVKMEFTMPEALTEWKFMGFAHDRELRGGLLTNKTVTAKDLMVEPNAPRFVREGDEIEFTVKVSNQTAGRQAGKVRLTFADARTLKPMDTALGNTRTEQDFDVPSKEARSYAWKLAVPDGADFLTYKAVGATASLSDGEEGYLPVLSRRILVTESLPLPVRGKQTKNFDFTRLSESGKSRTLQHQSLTVQMVSQPAWYAVLALPYLMEFPYECTEQTFNRLYANVLARHIANSDPKIRHIFDLWKGTPALDSPLEKNQDLKSVMLEETPWVRQAQNESQARRNVGILFDANRLNEETARLLRKLAEQQLADGAWPWFPGGCPNDYMTLYITTGFGRLRHLGAEIDPACALKALGRLDSWIDKTYREILAHGDKDANHLNSTIALYLYGRSFFLKDKPVAGAPREAVDYFLGQARQHWLKLDCRQSQAHLAVALKRFGYQETSAAIMKSIKERSVSNEELGMFWRETELSWWWYRAPIETQAMMIEAFDEVMNDAQAVEDCKVWLLKQKQTQDWKTTKATADAVYGLLMRGTGLLASDALVEVSLAGETIKPEKVEAGTGFYEQRFARGEIKPAMGHITVKKTDDGVSWGSVHWQYLEDVTKVTPYAGTPLKLKKMLFIKENTKKGQMLRPVGGALSVGDELVVRIELRVDRDMEYVHLKDQRGSGTEPVNVLSRYKYQDGLAYYESTRDTASHFFIDYLPKGTYVFEYSTRVVHKGKYQSGMAEIQCMYAPEFNSHSDSFELKVE